MDATNSLQTASLIISQLRKDYPNIRFVEADSTSWSAQNSIISYSAKSDNSLIASLLHELGHAIADHKNYSNDYELLKMESEAWVIAKKLSKKYNFEINNDHIEDCLDTYRDWLHKRSSCPKCATTGIQVDKQTYKCLNCYANWKVGSSRFCRAYRKQIK